MKRKMLRAGVTLLLAVICLFGLCTTALAAEQTYTANNVTVTVTVPDSVAPLFPEEGVPVTVYVKNDNDFDVTLSKTDLGLPDYLSVSLNTENMVVPAKDEATATGYIYYALLEGGQVTSEGHTFTVAVNAYTGVLPDDGTLTAAAPADRDAVMANVDEANQTEKMVMFTLASDGQPEGYVKVFVQVPADWGTEDLHVFGIHTGVDEAFAETPETVAGVQYVTFLTNHLGNFALVKDEEEVPPETTVPETTVPETTAPEATTPVTTQPETTAPGTTAPSGMEPPKTGDAGIGIFVIIAVAALVAAVFCGKKLRRMMMVVILCAALGIGFLFNGSLSVRADSIPTLEEARNLPVAEKVVLFTKTMDSLDVKFETYTANGITAVTEKLTPAVTVFMSSPSIGDSAVSFRTDDQQVRVRADITVELAGISDGFQGTVCLYDTADPTAAALLSATVTGSSHTFEDVDCGKTYAVYLLTADGESCGFVEVCTDLPTMELNGVAFRNEIAGDPATLKADATLTVTIPDSFDGEVVVTDADGNIYPVAADGAVTCPDLPLNSQVDLALEDANGVRYSVCAVSTNAPAMVLKNVSFGNANNTVEARAALTVTIPEGFTGALSVTDAMGSTLAQVAEDGSVDCQGLAVGMDHTVLLTDGTAWFASASFNTQVPVLGEPAVSYKDGAEIVTMTIIRPDAWKDTSLTVTDSLGSTPTVNGDTYTFTYTEDQAEVVTYALRGPAQLGGTNVEVLYDGTKSADVVLPTLELLSYRFVRGEKGVEVYGIFIARATRTVEGFCLSKGVNKYPVVTNTPSELLLHTLNSGNHFQTYQQLYHKESGTLVDKIPVSAGHAHLSEEDTTYRVDSSDSGLYTVEVRCSYIWTGSKCKLVLLDAEGNILETREVTQNSFITFKGLEFDKEYAVKLYTPSVMYADGTFSADQDLLGDSITGIKVNKPTLALGEITYDYNQKIATVSVAAENIPAFWLENWTNVKLTVTNGTQSCTLTKADNYQGQIQIPFDAEYTLNLYTVVGETLLDTKTAPVVALSVTADNLECPNGKVYHFGTAVSGVPAGWQGTLELRDAQNELIGSCNVNGYNAYKYYRSIPAGTTYTMVLKDVDGNTVITQPLELPFRMALGDMGVNRGRIFVAVFVPEGEDPDEYRVRFLGSDDVTEVICNIEDERVILTGDIPTLTCTIILERKVEDAWVLWDESSVTFVNDKEPRVDYSDHRDNGDGTISVTVEVTDPHGYISEETPYKLVMNPNQTAEITITAPGVYTITGAGTEDQVGIQLHNQDNIHVLSIACIP